MRRRARVRWTVDLAPGQLTAAAWVEGACRWEGAAPWTEAHELAAALPALLGGAPPAMRRGAVTATLARPLVQVRRLADLPPVRPRRLPQLLEASASRYFRRNGVPLVVAAAWVPTTEGRAALAAAVEAPLLEALATALAATALHPVTIHPRELPVLALEAPGRRAASRVALRRAARRWALGAVVAWSLVAAAALGRLALERRAVTRELARLAAPAAALATARQALHEATTMVDAVETTTQARGTLRRRLTAVVSALPDSAVLASLTLGDSGTGALTGWAPRASAVVAGLGRLPDAAPVRLDGQPGREVQWGREGERFSLLLGAAPAREETRAAP